MHASGLMDGWMDVAGSRAMSIDGERSMPLRIRAFDHLLGE